jgi:hypothetical protein
MRFVFPFGKIVEGSGREVEKEAKTPDIPYDFAA